MTMTTNPELRILSLGAGVQSTVLALMACDGTLPGLDAAIFADTGWEPPAVSPTSGGSFPARACIAAP